MQSEIKLDRTSRKLVNWYAKESLRDPVDIVNGILSGNLGHLRQELSDEMHDDSPDHCRWYVEDAIRRRLGRKPRYS